VLVTTVNYTTCRDFPYEDQADPVITTLWVKAVVDIERGIMAVGGTRRICNGGAAARIPVG